MEMICATFCPFLLAGLHRSRIHAARAFLDIKGAGGEGATLVKLATS